MIDVGLKSPTQRMARAEAWIEVGGAIAAKLRKSGGIAKGSVLETARIAGIMAAKRTSELIPMCHPLPVGSIALEAQLIGNRVLIKSEVRYSGKLIEQVESLASAVRVGGLILVCMLSVATLLIVMNTIRLTVIAREKDISIMKLVGATDTFIKWPFIIEGLIIGLVGALFSFVILKISYDVVFMQLSMAMPFLPLISDQRHLIAVYLIVGCVGVVLGMIGGYISVSKSLKEFD